MDLYTSTAYKLAEQLTKRYSTSFSMSSRLFHRSIRSHIYAIYGLVRIADEIVDTYEGSDAAAQLERVLSETKDAIEKGYSTNPIIHAFARTARQYHIDESLIVPFFESMALDLQPQTYTNELYERYIYGSAEVVGLMCLRVFVEGDDKQYRVFEFSARALGAAYQKVNFLRDMRADHEVLGRTYFPGIDYSKFDEAQKQAIVSDIEHDYVQAKKGIDTLPHSARKAVRASYYYYAALLAKLRRTPAAEIKMRRVRVSNMRKLYLLAKAGVGA